MKWSKKYSSKLLNINMLYLDANALKRGVNEIRRDALKRRWPQRAAAGLIHVLLAFWLTTALSSAQGTNLTSVPSPLPEMGFSVVRVFGSLILVLALFLGAVWLFKNWQRVAIYKGRAPKLNVLEVKSLGNRHALYLVGYEDQRFLISSSPAGVNLLTHLPEADGELVAAAPAPTFAQSLRQTLAPKS